MPISETGASSIKQASAPQEQQGAGWVGVPVPIIATGITVCGAVVLALLVNRWNKRRESDGRTASAVTKLHESFAPAIAAIEGARLGHLSLMDFLRTAYDERHAAAVIAFEPFVTPNKLNRFCDAWNRYRYGEDENGKPANPASADMNHEDLYFLCYTPPGSTWETHIKTPATQKALERIRAFLKCASEI